MLNGSGLRTVLWVSGCSMHCYNCQNPQTHDPNSGIPFDKEAEKELFDACKPSYIAGLTLLGGDPLEWCNIEECTRIAKRFKELFPNKTLWLYTGRKWIVIKRYEIMQYVDVCVDGPFIDELKDVNYHWAGSTNQKVIDVQKSLKSKEVVLYED